MWWAAAMMAVVAATAVVDAQQFNPNDESDYIDDVEEVESSSKWRPSRSRSRGSDTVFAKEGRTANVHGVVEKLLGQPIIQYEYEGPGTIVIRTGEATRGPTGGPARSPSPSRDQTRVSRSRLQPDVHWSDRDQQVLGLSRFKTHKSKTRRGRHRTTEVIYSVRVPQWDDDLPQIGQKFRPGVIESLVNAHKVIRYETPRNPPELYNGPTRTTHHVPTRTYHGPTRTYHGPTRTYHGPTRTAVNQTAYNEGGFRTTQYEDHLRVLPLASTDGRRYLLTVPGAHLTAKTRPRRPTPITEPLTFSYMYTRRTVRHPNCTDSYYQCLQLCFDHRGYRVKCPWDTPSPPTEPRRMNYTGLFWAIHQEPHWSCYDVSQLFATFRSILVQRSYRECRTFTTRTTTTPKVYPIYYDDPQYLGPKTGQIVAKCWVCGLLETGIPHNEHCAESFGENPSARALAEKNSYKRYCRYMNDVPLWFNRSDPLSLHGVWTGGCSKRWLDLSGLYTQRTCRSVVTPAVGHHFLSKRMARLELALKGEYDGCVVSPMATLVPFSRAISLYARFHVCVCRGPFCNLASRKDLSLGLIILCLIMIVRVRGL